MDNDDLPVGRILSRRETLALLGAAGLSALAPFGAVAAAAAMPGCIVRPEMIEGPYFVDERLERSDIRPEPSTGEVPPGVPLTLGFVVSRVGGGTCVPLQGATIDLWQCDAGGEYSAFEDRRAGFDTRGKAFLRGYQVTDAGGRARFTTIYPGWYPGRAVHIHFKIRTASSAGRTWEFTSQLYFDEALTDRVHARLPYAAKGRRDTMNERDGFFPRGGDQLLLSAMPDGDGFDATFSIGLDLANAEIGRPDGRRSG
jgi:protocatechuate 3,4-dioxygenase beta subunit